MLIFHYCPNCPNSPKLQILVNIPVDKCCCGFHKTYVWQHEYNKLTINKCRKTTPISSINLRYCNTLENYPTAINDLEVFRKPFRKLKPDFKSPLLRYSVILFSTSADFLHCWKKNQDHWCANHWRKWGAITQKKSSLKEAKSETNSRAS